jgi:hypothetical protein
MLLFCSFPCFFFVLSSNSGFSFLEKIAQTGFDSISSVDAVCLISIISLNSVIYELGLLWQGDLFHDASVVHASLLLFAEVPCRYHRLR